MIESVTCNLCGADSPRIVFKRHSSQIVQCSQCGLIYENPRISESFSIKEAMRGRAPGEQKKEVWHDAKAGLFKSNLKKIENLCVKGRVLDVGCGYGAFLAIARESGWQVEGVEIAEPACQFTQNNLNLKVHNSIKEGAFPDRHFEAVTFWEVLDIFYDPLSELKEALRVLKPQGVIALRLQNSIFHVGLERFLLSLGNPHRALHIKPTSFHRYGFSSSTVRKLLAKAGFQDIRVCVSEFTAGDPYETGGMLGKRGVQILKQIIYYFSLSIFYISAGKTVISPSMLVFARKPSTARLQKKVKVLHLITRLDKGGSAQNTLATLALLDKNKYKVALMSGLPADPEGLIAGFLQRHRIDSYATTELVREVSFFNDIKAFIKLFIFLRNEKFDIVHTHTSKAGILGRWAAKLAGVKIIIHTPHGHIFYGYFGKCKTMLFLCLERATSLITDKIITLTQRGKEEHTRLKVAPAEKFLPIYSGIDVAAFTHYPVDKLKQREALRLASDTPLIGTVTRLEPVKGNRYLIEALVNVIAEFASLRLIIIGDGPEKRRLQAHAEELGVAESVLFLGAVHDIRPWVSIFDIFVLPSLNEGMGRCLLEAQALGVPVIATSVGGIPEIVKDGVTGMLVPAKDAKSLAQAIINLLKNKELRQSLAAEAKISVNQEFSREKMVEKISELYEQFIWAKL